MSDPYYPEAGHYVEYQPFKGNQPRGKSYNRMIRSVLPNEVGAPQYLIHHNGKWRVIERREILCRNLKGVKF